MTYIGKETCFQRIQFLCLCSLFLGEVELIARLDTQFCQIKISPQDDQYQAGIEKKGPSRTPKRWLYIDCQEQHALRPAIRIDGVPNIQIVASGVQIGEIGAHGCRFKIKPFITQTSKLILVESIMLLQVVKGRELQRNGIEVVRKTQFFKIIQGLIVNDPARKFLTYGYPLVK